ncbi:hypothetical protein JHK87_005954 [Glycine soja]|nr:hypothetical protein JHK87_005954 [Glycine soja]
MKPHSSRSLLTWVALEVKHVGASGKFPSPLLSFMKTISCTSQGVEISILNNDKHHKALKIGSKCMWKFNINYRSGVVVAKYGDKNVYFDLEDLGNTIGQWDLYGSDAPSPYNPFQV